MRSAAAVLAALMVTAPTMAAEEAAVVAVRDLRAERWRTTAVINVGSAAIQHTGDDTRLGQAIASGTATDSVACEPGWEGGQPRRD